MLDCEHFAGDVVDIARDLIGRMLIVDGADGRRRGLIVETEAYGDETDPASHAAFRSGGRASVMWNAPGTIYVYAAYGMYPCLNIVTGPNGIAGAVLIRGVWLEGEREPVLGPGRVGRALRVTLDDHDETVCGQRFGVRSQRTFALVEQTTRIGVRRGVELPWRFVANGIDRRRV